MDCGQNCCTNALNPMAKKSGSNHLFRVRVQQMIESYPIKLRRVHTVRRHNFRYLKSIRGRQCAIFFSQF